MSEQREYPEPTAKPCNECPWRRIAVPGHLGPHSAEFWAGIAHGDGPVACHKTIRRLDSEGNGVWDDPAMRQCRGMAIFRRNVLKTPRNPSIVTGPHDEEAVFASNEEFINHHESTTMKQVIIEGSTELMVEKLERVLEDVRQGNPGHLENMFLVGMGEKVEVEFSPSDPSEDPDGDWSVLSLELR